MRDNSKQGDGYGGSAARTAGLRSAVPRRAPGAVKRAGRGAVAVPVSAREISRLELDRFWAPRLRPSRQGTRWLDVLKTLECYRLIDPGSEWRLHRQWYGHSAMGDLLASPMSVVPADTLYRCLDKLLAHKRAFFSFLRARWETLVEAHILLAFIAYCLHVTLKNLARPRAPGLTPRAILKKFATLQMVDVHLPTADGRHLVLPRHTQPERDHQLLLDQLKLSLPDQPLPRISA